MLTSSLLLEVRRMFSLLYYRVILPRVNAFVKGKIGFFRGFLGMPALLDRHIP